MLSFFIKNGRIIDIIDMKKLREEHKSIFHIGFCGGSEEMKLTVNSDECSRLFAQLKGRNVKYIREESYTLEDCFNEAYRRENG